MTMFASVLIANRGEIAVRIMRTLRAKGIRGVAVFTESDRDALHVSVADEAVAIPSYLDVEAVVGAAVKNGCAAIHPGYGFLSENPVLARRCSDAGVTFIGPPAAAIEAMGDKINAKRMVAAAGVPVVPGRDEPGLDDEQLAEAALKIGLPVLLKPSAGGGGKGMRRVDQATELRIEIAAARREAAGAFGDGTLLVERFVSRPRHIEIQIFADTHGRVCSLGERECSLQRRHQKIVEESPSVLLDDATRAAMGASAAAAAAACGYVGAGTVEFIVSADRPAEYFFMEMNTRLQVEHPVTEAVLGVDLVEWQLRVAAGEPLPWEAGGPVRNGHAVEARVYAEDPARGFLPSAGRVRHLSEPTIRTYVRVDSGLRPGTVVGTDYDPMLSKVVAWGEDRATALNRLHAALGETQILGLTTNVGFLRRLLVHPDVVAGHLDTELVDRIAPSLVGDAVPPHVVAAAALLQRLLAEPARPIVDPWNAVDGWRLLGPAAVASEWQVGGTSVPVAVTGDSVRVGSQNLQASARLEGESLVVDATDGTWRLAWAVDGDVVWLGHQGDTWMLTRLRETIDRTGNAEGAGLGPLTSPMPGTVLAVNVSPGDEVTAGQSIVVVEAMKMEHAVVAPADGTVTEVLVRTGDRVALDQPLAVVAAA
jgi:acetyl-CoA/propionyl-CoA carboxylase biotin carboxyl carrier protein